jgi:hypothetical protein
MSLKDKEWDAKYKSFAEIQSTNKFVSMWSIYDGVNDPTELSPYEGKTMSYMDNWGEPVEVTLPNGPLSWLQLWEAADKCIKQSGDNHHIFIEGFRKNGGILELITGS